ncbi:uncharacterized protein [Drosophila tropicalis]|uniref:uncharacterized protein n=1 Tax=Drosophila tropicalis TaxID=46794 RepID=UPI0035AC0076
MSAYTLFTFVTVLLYFTVCNKAYQVLICGDYHHGLSFADPLGCSGFYVCLRGQLLRHECSIGLVFDPKTQSCNLPFLVQCFNGDRSGAFLSGHQLENNRNPVVDLPYEKPAAPPQPCDKPPPPTPCNKPPPALSTTPPPFILSTVAPLISPKDCIGLQDGTLFADAKHCRCFYVCRHNHAKRQSCPPGQWFDREIKACRIRSDVKNCLANRN